MPDLLKSISEFGFAAYQPRKNIDRLSIQLRLNGFSFCISDPLERKIHYFVEYKIPDYKSRVPSWQEITNLFEDWLLQKKWTSEQFRDTQISIESPNFNLLPSSFVSKENLEDQINFSQSISYQFVVVKNKILNTSQELLIAIHKGLRSVINEYLSTAKINHSISILHDSIISKSIINTDDDQIFAYISERNLYLMAYIKKELVFANSYHFTSKEDFIYFILLVYQTVNLTPEKNQLNLLGEISPSSALYNICYQYIRNISLLNKIENMNLDPDFDSFPIHQYYIQINQAL